MDELSKIAYQCAFGRELRKLGFDGTVETAHLIGDAHSYACGVAGEEMPAPLVRVLVETQIPDDE